MGREKWQEKILRTAEAGVSTVVDRVLSRSYLGRGRCAAGVQEVLASLDTPSREETDALREEVQRLGEKIQALSARVEGLTGAPGGGGQTV